MVDSPSNESLDDLRRQWQKERTAPAMLHLANECRKQGRLAEAIAVLREGVRLHPARLAPRIALGRCSLESGDTSAAVEILDAVVEQDPTQLVANKLLVEAHLNRREVEQAARRLDLYETLNPGDPEVEELRSRLEAAQLAGRAAPAGPKDPPTPTDQPATSPPGFGGIGRPSSAWDDDEAVSLLADSEPEPLGPPPSMEILAQPTGLASADLFPVESQSGSAADDYWASMSSGPFGSDISTPPRPTGPVPTATLGNLYLQQGHRAEAARIFRQVLEISPNHREAQKGIAVAAKNHRPPTAGDLLRSASAGEPATPGAAARESVLRAYLQVVLERG